MNICITGGAGFIGANLIRRIRELFIQVNIVVIDNLSTGIEDNLIPGITFYDNDIRHRNTIKWIFEREKIDTVIHLAAESGVLPSLKDTNKNFSNNVKGIFSCLEAAKEANVKSFIFASSGGTVLGHQDPPAHEEIPAKPASPYGASKVAGEAYCLAYSASFGLNTTIFRFSNVFGPYASHKNGNLTPEFIKALKKDKTLSLYSNGISTRDFIYVDDISDAIIKSLCRPTNGEIIQLGTGIETTVEDFVYLFNNVSYSILNKIVNIEKIDSTRIGEVSRNYVLIDKAKKILDWFPKVTLEEGMKKIIQKEFYE